MTPPLDSRGLCAVCGRRPTSPHRDWCAGVAASLRREWHRDMGTYGPDAVCIEDGCSARPHARERCKYHYNRWYDATVRSAA